MVCPTTSVTVVELADNDAYNRLKSVSMGKLLFFMLNRVEDCFTVLVSFGGGGLLIVLTMVPRSYWPYCSS